MIIQVRGAPSSGKSWVIRQVMSQVISTSNFSWEPDTIDSRKNPTYYKFYRYGRERRTLIVLGQYENSEAGVDSIGSIKSVYSLLNNLNRDTAGQKHFLMESHYLSYDVEITRNSLIPTRVIYLESEVQDKGVNLSRVKLRVPSIVPVLCRRVSSEQAVRLIMEWIK